MKRLPRRWLSGLVASAALLLSGCASWDGHLDLFGYTTRPNYNPGIKTVYLTIFGNATLRKGLEFDLTRALVREIESKTPWKVVSDRSCADTELFGKFVNRSKNLAMVNQDGEVRDATTTLTVEVVWRDLRPGHNGEILSLPRAARPTDPAPDYHPPAGTPPPVIVQAQTRFTPELGQSLSTAEQTMVNSLAVQIISMMETPW